MHRPDASPNCPATSSSGFPSNHFGETLHFDDLSMFDWLSSAPRRPRQPDGFIPALAPDFDWVVDIYQKA